MRQSVRQHNLEYLLKLPWALSKAFNDIINIHDFVGLILFYLRCDCDLKHLNVEIMVLGSLEIQVETWVAFGTHGFHQICFVLILSN